LEAALLSCCGSVVLTTGVSAAFATVGLSLAGFSVSAAILAYLQRTVCAEVSNCDGAEKVRNTFCYSKDDAENGGCRKIADCSHCGASNVGQTTFSVAASLNLIYPGHLTTAAIYETKPHGQEPFSCASSH
jgi:hypothetical protein